MQYRKLLSAAGTEANRFARLTLRLIFILAIGVLSGEVLIANEDRTDIDNTRAALGKWVETQRIISQEKRDLALSKEMLNERIELVQREIDSLRGKIREGKDSIAEADKKRAAMIEENEILKNTATSLSNNLIVLEEKVKDLLKRLPDPIQERVKPLSQRLPTDVHNAKQSMAERFQNIVGILNEIDKFNREISLTSEVRTLANGSSVEVAALYVGVAQAYYTNAQGTIGGFGAPSDVGWIWSQDNDAAAQIAAAVAILKNEKAACFVQLPVEIK